MGDGPGMGERAEIEEQSDINEGAPSADICEYADGEGRGVSTSPWRWKPGTLEGKLMCGGAG